MQGLLPQSVWQLPEKKTELVEKFCDIGLFANNEQNNDKCVASRGEC
jgi:hypothetical protein